MQDTNDCKQFEYNGYESTSTGKQLTAKEIRRLEWQKKLAQSKLLEKKDTGNLSKSELKVKRREIQETQRLAKVQVKECKPNIDHETPKLNPQEPIIADLEVVNNDSFQAKNVSLPSKSEYDKAVNFSNIHPSFLRLGDQSSNGIIIGSNARCRSLLMAILELLEDLDAPTSKDYSRYLESILDLNVDYLEQCRPLGVSMLYMLRYLKMHITKIHDVVNDEDKKKRLYDAIKLYVTTDIYTARKAISLKLNEKLNNGDIILTFGCSSLVRNVILHANKEGKKFEIIIADGGPLFEGREMLRRLTAAGIQCIYILWENIPDVINTVTKTLLGAHALNRGGHVTSRIGTAQVALVCRAFNKPVIVCSETYKFNGHSKRNDADRDKAGKVKELTDAKSLGRISSSHRNKLLLNSNWLLDTVAVNWITSVATELDILPCTSMRIFARAKSNGSV